MTYDRRTFLELSGAALLARHASRLPRQTDLVLRNATVYDGSGQSPTTGDVAVTGDRITAVGPSLPTSGATVVELGGLALAPGFIDIHSHTDTELFVNPTADSKIRQGVTTEIAGQDGSSMGPWTQARSAEMTASYRDRFGITTRLGTLGAFFQALEKLSLAV